MGSLRGADAKSTRQTPPGPVKNVTMKAAIISFPGSNREIDAEKALLRVGFTTINTIFHTATDIDGYDLVLLPGGFSYGDYLRTGAMAVHSPIMPAIKAHAARGGLTLGICNGFQILCEAGLLPGAMMRNNHLKFNCKQVQLRIETTRTPFTSGYQKGQIITVPVAHGDGNYQADADTIKMLEDTDRIAFRYVMNPNGSNHDIAGILNETGTVCGLMPHPEDATAPWHTTQDGLGMFSGLVTKLMAA